MTRIISPSVLAADFGHLEHDTLMLNESDAEWVHFDVMDGVFVPNISFGFPVMKAITKVSHKFMDVHLMIVEPERYVKRFADAGAHLVTVHYEAVKDLRETLRLIKSCGVKAGVSVKPATPVEVLEEYLPDIDLALIMSVEPGFGGQSFMPASYDKVRKLRHMIDSRNCGTLIEIDGGISSENAGSLFEAGCNVLVAGSAVFNSPDPKAEISKMLNAR